jgi:hypothetical protein
MIERGETRTKQLSELVGVSSRRVGALVVEARKRIAIETDEPPSASRTKLASRFDKLYREAIESYETCKARGDRKNSSEFLRTAVAVVSQAGKVLGIESLPSAVGQQPNVRVIFEDFLEAPAAAKAAFARAVQAASGPSEVPQLVGEIQDPGVRSEMGQGLRDDDGAAPARDVSGDRAGE